MPMSIVVGGQFGSEGKGKIALYLARQRQARAVVRVGGPNSGHTVIDHAGRARIFRQLPTAAILGNVDCVISAGSYIDLDVLRAEISQSGLSPKQVKIDPRAVIINAECKDLERSSELRARVGSTLTGTGAAVAMRVTRSESLRFAKDEPELAGMIEETAEYLDRWIQQGDRVVAEGSQGFGLSVLHGSFFPYATSRDTTAAGVLSEVGLSPLIVDEVALVIRAFPIRVPGNSGPLPNETSWEAIARDGGFEAAFSELTSVTRSKRRVARFDPEVVRGAIRANAPSAIFLNHLDYVDSRAAKTGLVTKRVEDFVQLVDASIGSRVSHIGLGPSICIPSEAIGTSRSAA